MAHSWENGLFALPPGVDFASSFVDGLIGRMAGQPPEALARVTVWLNSGRTLLAVRRAFDTRGAFLLPRLRLVTELGAGPGTDPEAPPLASPLRRELELGALLELLLRREPDLAAGQSVPQLAASLAELMVEMQTEGRGPEALDAIDVANHAAHWDRAHRFLKIAADFYLTGGRADRAARQRAAADSAIARWAAGQDLPDHPVIVAGSTGSHGATREFMQAVAALPMGAVVLPGYDFDLPGDVWAGLDARSQDHPQHRFAPLMQALGQDPEQMRRWLPGAIAPAPGMNRLMSLALRPAPVTDQWIEDGPNLPDLLDATAHVTLIEADSPGAEADTIAAFIRDAVQNEQRVTLIAADRMLTRRVAAALDRWRLIPDDSAGEPLSLSAVGLFLRHVADLFGQALTVDALLTVLKHPLAAKSGDRGNHLRFTRDLELYLRRHGPAFPDAPVLAKWVKRWDEPARNDWAAWLASVLDRIQDFAGDTGPRLLAARLADHLALAGAIAAGPAGDGAVLWDNQAGGKARSVMDELADCADHAYPMTPRDYADLLLGQLTAQSTAREEIAHPLIQIRGPREARTDATGLVILAGLNEGGWPQALSPDPWLSRQMRLDAGLTLPERRIGLSAHDFQQAIAAESVVLSRASRDAEAETIPSRWLNRMMNLMRGLPERSGPEALAAMRARGAAWLDMAEALNAPRIRLDPAPRPSPVPPAPAFDELPVTAIRTLIRDPYAVYAGRVLGLRPLDPLRAEPDAALRGQVLHKVAEQLLKPPPAPDTPPETLRARFLAITAEVLAEEVPWPAARAFWQARMERIADRLVSDELARAAAGQPVVVEKQGRIALPGFDFTLTAKPDRIDRLYAGTAHVFDYKSGTPPSDKVMAAFDKQLLLEAAMVARGGFEALGPLPVAAISYIQLGGKGETQDRTLDDLPDQTWQGLVRLMAGYLKGGRGFTARRAMQKIQDASDYDQLARFGEWSLADAAKPEKVGQ